jgi:hypothetical protein
VHFWAASGSVGERQSTYAAAQLRLWHLYENVKNLRVERETHTWGQKNTRKYKIVLVNPRNLNFTELESFVTHFIIYFEKNLIWCSI